MAEGEDKKPEKGEKPAAADASGDAAPKDDASPENAKPTPGEAFVPEPPDEGPKSAPPSAIREYLSSKKDAAPEDKKADTAPEKPVPEKTKISKSEQAEVKKAKKAEAEAEEAEAKEAEAKKVAAKEAASEASSAAVAKSATKIERPTQAASTAKPAPRRKSKRRPEGARRATRREAKRARKENRGLGAKIFIGLFRIVAVLIIFTGLGVAGYVALYVNDLSQDLPDYSALTEYEPDIMTRIHAGDGTLIAEDANERRLFIPIGQVPDHVVHAFVAAEDQHFYEHPGIDLRGIARASVSNIFNHLNGRRLEGASTITQQVAKNFLLSSEVSIDRKVREQLLALRIERTFSKDEILELYLNQIYLGWRSYGIAAAALNYFNKPLDELTIAEAAYLAVMPKAPNNYRPDRESTRARSLERRNYVLNRMAEDGYITRAEANEATNEALVVYDRPVGSQAVEAEYFSEEVRRELANEFGFDALLDGGLSVRTTIDMEYQRIARDALRHGLWAYDQRHGWRGPVAHLDTMDDWRQQVASLELPRDLAPWRPAMVLRVNDVAGTVLIGLADEDGASGVIPLSEMEWAREQAANGIDLGEVVHQPSQVLSVGDVIWVEPVEIVPPEVVEGEDAPPSSNVTSFDQPTFGLRQVPLVNGGIMAMDPHTGRILAMVGGFSFDASEFNRATQARRQPGSSFKPYVYAAALEAGRTPSDLILDAPFVMPQGEGLPLWRPDNYSDRFYGPSTLRSGVERSRNAMTVRLAQDIGMERVVDMATRFGVVDYLDPYLAYALGAGETTLQRQVTGFSQFVNGGRRLQPYVIERVQDRFGRTVERADTRECEDCNMDEWDGSAAPELPDNREEILDPRTAYQVVSILEGVVQRGTGRSLRSLGVPLGGKTGTTNDERDAWFMGISPDLVVGAYVGFDNPLPMGRAETGGRVAAPVVREFFEHTVATRPPIPFRRPPGIRIVRVDAETGQLAQPGDLNVIEEAFRPGTEPSGERTVIGADGYTTQSNDDDELRSGSGGLY
jgi:penicillin-binding protein 1A